jgi:hypothetical protein
MRRSYSLASGRETTIVNTQINLLSTWETDEKCELTVLKLFYSMKTKDACEKQCDAIRLVYTSNCRFSDSKASSYPSIKAFLNGGPMHLVPAITPYHANFTQNVCTSVTEGHWNSNYAMCTNVSYLI